MRLRYRELRLKVPSLYQINEKAKGRGGVWCGRTSAAMIHNYYAAARAGGMENAAGKLAINQRDKAPYDLVLPDGTRVVNGYMLLNTLARAKSGWHTVIVQTKNGPAKTPQALYPKSERSGNPPTEAQIREILARPLRALDMFNPALCYTGLSANSNTSRHIVVLSGYRIGPAGDLWLHIDDPGSQFSRDGNGAMTSWGTADNLSNTGGNGTSKEEVLVQLEPETHDTAAGRSYWLKASRLFEPNQFSKDPNDLWCDHVDRPGLCVYFNDREAEPMSPCVVTSAAGAGLPVAFGGPSARPGEQLALAHEAARGAEAPYPMGGNRVWHNGVHLVVDGAKDEPVHAVAPGEIVFARFAEAAEGATEDVGAVLVRHAFDPATLRIVDPRDDMPGSVSWLYSLSMHLGPGSREVFLSRLEHGDKPKKRMFIPGPAPCELFGYDAEGNPISVPALFEAGRAIEDEETFKLSTEDGKHDGLLAIAGESNLAAWEDSPQAPGAPKGVPLALWDPVHEELIELDAAVGKGSDAKHVPTLATTPDRRGRPELAEVHKKRGTHWVETTDAAGVQVAPVHYCVHEHADLGFLDPPEALQVGPQRNYRYLGVAVFREERVRMAAVFEGGKRQRGRLLLGGVDREPMRFYDDREQPAAKVGAKRGAALRPNLSPCVRESERSAKSTRLCLFNDLTERVMETTLFVSRPAVPDRAVRYGTFIAIAGVHAELEVRLGPTQACIHSKDEVQAMTEVARRHWPLMTCFDDDLPIWLRTLGEGDRRSFPDSSIVTIDAQRRSLAVREGPVMTSGRQRVWPAVSVVAGLDKKQFKELAKALDEANDGPAGQTLRRLEQGQSRLVGAQLGRSDGWEVRDGVLDVREGHTEPLSLYVEVEGKGAGRSFPEHIDDCDRPKLEIDPATWPGLRAVSEFRSNGRDRAFVEIVPAVDRKAWQDNKDEIDAWKDADKFAKKVEKALDEGEAVDLAALEQGEALFEQPGGRFANWRFTAREPIGTVGRLDEERMGLHLEMFAGSNILPDDGPNGVWLEVSTEHRPATEAFANDVADKLVNGLELDKVARRYRDGMGSVIDAIADAQPFPERLWRELCADEQVHRALAQVIAIHPTEWSIDWKDVAEQTPSLRILWDALNRQTVGWWPTSIDLKGLSGDDWYFYQPLRLIEWLTTGVDARVETPGDEAAAMQLVLGDHEYEMAPSDNDEEGEVFRSRTVIGARAEHLDAAVMLGEGIETANRQVPIRLVRGEVVSMWLCQPKVEMAEAMAPITSRAAVPYNLAQALGSLGKDQTTHLLADPSDVMAADGTSRATFLAEVDFNVEMPTMLEFSIPDGFCLEHMDVAGAIPESDLSGKQAIMLEPESLDDGASAGDVMHRSLQVRLVVAPTAQVGASGAFSVTFSGGDLTEPTTAEWTLATREIGAGAIGRDVAKLQQYLHHLQADGAPCYRAQQEEGEEEKAVAAVPIDGDAGPGTARAVWRFVEAYRASGRWDPSHGTIEGTKGSYTLDFEAPAPAAGTIEGLAEALYETYGHPTVDAGLIAELARHFEIPAVLPAVELGVTPPALAGDLGELSEKMSASGRSTLVPSVDAGGQVNHVHVTVALAEPVVPGDPAAVAANLVLGEGTPYTIVGESSRDLATLINDGVELRPNGVAATDAEASMLYVIADGGATLASIELGGARDLLAEQGSAKSLDAVLVQQWLARWPRPDAKNGEGYYTGTIDGEWGGGSAKSLAAFRNEELVDADYATVLEVLAIGPPAAAEPEPLPEAAQ